MNIEHFITAARDNWDTAYHELTGDITNHHARRLAIGCIRDGKIARAAKIAPISQLGHTQRSRLLAAYFQSIESRKTRDQQLANRSWRSLIRELEFGGEALIEVFGNRNRIFLLKREDLRDVIVIKKAPDLRKEYRMLDHLDRHLGRSSCFVKPLAFYKDPDGTHVVVSAMDQSEDLEDYLTDDLPLNEIAYEAEQTIRSLAAIHCVPAPPEGLPRYNPFNALRSRLVRRLGSNEETPKLLREYLAVYQERSFKRDTLSHGDFSIQNTKRNGKVLDAESFTVSDDAHDLENLLAAVQLRHLHHGRMAQIFEDELSELRGVKVKLANQDFWRMHVSLCYIGSYHNRSDHRRKFYSLHRAIATMEQAGMTSLRDATLKYLEKAPLYV